MYDSNKIRQEIIIMVEDKNMGVSTKRGLTSKHLIFVSTNAIHQIFCAIFSYALMNSDGNLSHMYM